MKKTLALIMALVLTMALVCAATAEVKTFVFNSVYDVEGNPVEGDFSALEGSSFTIDDEAMTCVGTAGEEQENGTVEIVEGAEDSVAILVTMESGEQANMTVYTIDDVWYLEMVNEEMGFIVLYIGE